MQSHVLLQLVMYNFLFCVIFVKKYCEFSVTLWGFFFLYNNDFPCEFLSQYSLQLAFVPLFSLQKLLCLMSHKLTYGSSCIYKIYLPRNFKFVEVI